MLRYRIGFRAGMMGCLLALVAGVARAQPASGHAAAATMQSTPTNLEWTMTPLVLDPAAKHPIIAATPEELQRYRAALASDQEPVRKPVAEILQRADKAMAAELVFPPRGGAHNQWYQCEPCQTGLQTLSDTQHRCPKCGKIYTGEPYDDVLFEKRHQDNLADATSAAWAYAITGKPEYAQFARQVLVGYAERYRNYPYHDNRQRTDIEKIVTGGRLSNQTLNESMMVSLSIAPAYDLIHDSPVLSDADHRAIRDDLILPILQGIDRHKAGKNNWQSWHNAAMLWGGAVIGDAAWITKALTDPENGFARQMQISVLPEGMWYENSWGYHFYTLTALTDTAEGARRLGVDVWSHPALRKMLLLPARYVMPDGTLPKFGDDVGSRPGSAVKQYEQAYHAYRDPALLQFLSGTPNRFSTLFGRDTSAKPVPAASVSEVLPGTGHALLRTRGRAGMAAALNFGPPGGFHGHFDKLSFVLYGHGTELGVDPGRAASQAYRLPIHRNWYRATISHNTVVVDGASQAEATGQLEAFAANADHALVLVRCDGAYEGIRHRRLLCLMPAYALVVDDLASDRDRQFDWVYHNRGTRALSDPAKDPAELADGFVGREFVQNLSGGQSDEPVRVVFPDEAVTTRVTADAQPGTTVFTGDGPGASVLERVPLAILRRTGTSVRFAATIEPVAAGEAQTVVDVTLQSTPDGLLVRVTRDGGVDEVRIGPDRVQVSANGKPALSAEVGAGHGD